MQKFGLTIFGACAALLIQIYFFLPLALDRMVERDGGFYALASVLVYQGQVLYRDFFYPQMPLMPYVYGLVMQIFGESWAVARGFSGVLAAATGTLLWIFLFKRFGAWWSVVGLALYMFSDQVFPWYTTVKAYGLSNFFLFLSFILLYLAPRHLALTASGLAFACAVNTRLYLAALFPVWLFLLWSWSQRQHQPTRPLIVSLVLGTAIGLAPNLYFFLNAPEAYIFNNLGYHLGRSGMTLQENLSSKWVIAAEIFALAGRQLISPHFPMLSILTLFYVLLWICWRWFQTKSKPELEWAFWVALALLIINFIPTPAYVQYFSSVFPYYIICAIALGAKVFSNTASIPVLLARAGAVAVLLVYYLEHLPQEIDRFTRTGAHVIGIGTARKAADWNNRTVEIISRTIHQNTEPGDYVFADWPGYVVGTHARMLPGMENHFSWRAGKQVSPEERAISKLTIRSEMQANLLAEKAKIVVMPTRIEKIFYRKMLATTSYKPLLKIGSLTVYKRSA